MTHKDVVRDGQQLYNIQFLVDAGDACFSGINGGTEFLLFAVDKNLTFLGHMYAGQNLNECGFPRAVFTDQSVNLTGTDGNRHFAQSHDTGELFGDPLQFNNIFALAHPASSLPFNWDSQSCP